VAIIFLLISRMPYLLDAYFNTGPEFEDQQQAVLDRFQELRTVGDVDPVTDEVLREPASLLSVHALFFFGGFRGTTRSSNVYLLAHVMRLTRPRQGKVYRLAVHPKDEQGQATSKMATQVAAYISLGKYDCMVWMRFVVALHFMVDV
jgi:hypothetical protein